MKRWTVVLAGALATVWCGTSFAKSPDGKPVFLKFKCNSCHSIEAAGIAKKAAATEEGEATPKKKPPDLSGVGLEKKAEWIMAFLQKKEKLESDLHPKKFRGTESELKTVAAWLETMKDEKAAHKSKEKAEDKEKEKEKGESSEKSEDGKSDH